MSLALFTVYGISETIILVLPLDVSSISQTAELADLVRRVVVKQVALMLGRCLEEIDPDIP